nr:protein DEK-like isoform X2 [Ipomoea trifida]
MLQQMEEDDETENGRGSVEEDNERRPWHVICKGRQGCTELEFASSGSVAEDVVVKLMEFLEAPHAMTSELLAEKEQVQHEILFNSQARESVRGLKSGSSASGSSKGLAKVDEGDHIDRT